MTCMSSAAFASPWRVIEARCGGEVWGGGGGGGSTERRPRQPCDSAMHPKMEHSIRLVRVLQPGVEGCVLWVRREVPLKQEPHGVTLQPQGRLHPNPHVAQLEPTHDALSCPCIHKMKGLPTTCMRG